MLRGGIWREPHRQYAWLQREDHRKFWTETYGSEFYDWYLKTQGEGAKESEPLAAPPHCSLTLELYENDKWRAILSEWHQPLWRDATLYCPNDDTCTETEGYRGCLPFLEIDIEDVSQSLIFTFCNVCRTVTVETQAC